MAVYVDNMRINAKAGRTSGIWCHLTADTSSELHEFAAKIGLKRSWFQPASVFQDTPFIRLREKQTGQVLVGMPRPGSRDHYDVTEKRRKVAVELGAIEVRIGHEPWRSRKRRS